MTSENCAKIAVKLDDLTDGVYSAGAFLSTFKKVVQEQYSIQLLECNVKSAKERKNKKNNRVQPVLLPDGRLPTVSFILQWQYTILKELIRKIIFIFKLMTEQYKPAICSEEILKKFLKLLSYVITSWAMRFYPRLLLYLYNNNRG